MKQYQYNWARESSAYAHSLSDKETVDRLKQDKALQARIQNVKIIKPTHGNTVQNHQHVRTSPCPQSL